jgi:hypothetical protein
MIRILLVILRARILLSIWGVGLMLLAGGLVQLGEGGRVADSLTVFFIAALLLSVAVAMTRRAVDALRVEERLRANRERRRREVELGK